MRKCLQIMHVITAFLNELFSKVFPLRFANLHITLGKAKSGRSKWNQREPSTFSESLSLFRTVLFHLTVIQPSRPFNFFRWGVHFLISVSSIFSLSNRPVWDMIVNFQSFGMSSWTRSGVPHGLPTLTKGRPLKT